MTDERVPAGPSAPYGAAVFVIAVLLLFAAALFYQRYETAHITREQHVMLFAIGELKAGQITQWRKDFQANARRSASSLYFRKALEDWLKNPDDPVLKEGIRNQLMMEQEVHQCSDVILLSTTGSILSASKMDPDPVDPVTQAAVQQALTTRMPVLSELYRCAKGKVRIDAVSGIWDLAGKPLGVMVLRDDPETRLYLLIRAWPTPSPSAETTLLRREGSAVLFLNDLRHQTNAALTVRIPVTQGDVPAVRAVLGTRGVFQGKDYRGVEVLADLRPLPDSSWFMVAKVDKREILAEVWYRNAEIALFLGLGVLLAALIASLMYRRRQAGLYRNLYEMERKEREAVEEFRTTLHSIGDAVITTDRQGRVRYLNPVAVQLTGWREEEAAGRPLNEVFRIVSEQTREPVDNPAQKVLREGRVVGLANHTVLISKEGIERPIADSGAPIRGVDGHVAGVVLVFRDQEHERKAEEALRESERRYRTLADSGQALIWTANTDKKCDYFNEIWLAFTGRTMAQELGDGWVEGVHPDDLNACVTLYGASFDRREPFSLVYRLRRHDGEYRWLQDNGTPRYDEAGEFLGYIGHCLDITGQKQADKEREALEVQLRQAQKMEAVGRLAGGVAHDFNNMLQVIRGYAEMLLADADPDDPKSADLREILKAAHRSAELTKQLLAFARKQTIDPRVLDVNDAIGDLIKMLRRLIGEDIDLLWKPAADPGCVRMDPSQVVQILTNLVVNARDAIKGVGKITIETRQADFDEATCRTHGGIAPGCYVLLGVSDDGVGMDKDTLAHLFEPFFTTKSRGKGSGLGLATVYGIVQQNKGFINVYSEVGKGTTFKIYLPRVDGDELADAPPAVSAGQPLGGGTVLLVEDEAALLVLAGRFLEQLGFTVLPASGPGEALKLAKAYEGRIDLLLTDVVMPEMSGRELWELLILSRPACQVIYMSGYTSNVIAHRGLLEKGTHFLEKPFSREALAAKLRELPVIQKD